MKKETIVQNIFHEEPQNFVYIESGLTNDNYIVTLNQRKVVLRIPRKENEGLFDYALESEILNKIKDLDLEPKLLYYNKITGVKCSEYIQNAKTFEPMYMKRAATLIKRLHESQISSGKTFDIKEKFNQFKNKIINPIFDTTFAHGYIDSLVLENITLCHNDLVEGNLIFTDSKDYLIDYEYAADNDPLFDVMSFITENDIVDIDLRQEFYLEYFGSLPDATTQKRLDHFEIVHHVLWCEWAMMMYELYQKPIYHEIAALKYQRLVACMKKK